MRDIAPAGRRSLRIHFGVRSASRFLKRASMLSSFDARSLQHRQTGFNPAGGATLKFCQCSLPSAFAIRAAASNSRANSTSRSGAGSSATISNAASSSPSSVERFGAAVWVSIGITVCRRTGLLITNVNTPGVTGNQSKFPSCLPWRIERRSRVACHSAAMALTLRSAISDSLSSAAFSSLRVSARTAAQSSRPSCLAHAISVP